MQMDQASNHSKMYKEMQDAMNLGRGTLKQQIEKELFKSIKIIEATVDRHVKQVETLQNAHEL
jgi:hypothetical protein